MIGNSESNILKELFQDTEEKTFQRVILYRNLFVQNLVRVKNNQLFQNQSFRCSNIKTLKARQKIQICRQINQLEKSQTESK